MCVSYIITEKKHEISLYCCVLSIFLGGGGDESKVLEVIASL